jgi:DNA-directed RNA polymerase subunit M/transcription elongation factor TFIIS
MDISTKKIVSIVVAIACLALAVIIMIKTHNSRSSGDIADHIQMLCTNPKCGQSYVLSEKQFKAMISNEAPMSMQTPSFSCPKCKQKTAGIAMKCEKCGNVFLPNYRSPQNLDKCPKCGFSKSHQ